MIALRGWRKGLEVHLLAGELNVSTLSLTLKQGRRRVIDDSDDDDDDVLDYPRCSGSAWKLSGLLTDFPPALTMLRCSEGGCGMVRVRERKQKRHHPLSRTLTNAKRRAWW